MDGQFVIAKPEKKDGDQGWAEKARQSHGKAGEFFKKYSDQLNLGGTTVLLMGGGAMLMASSASSSPLTEGLALTAGASAIAAGVLKLGGIAGARNVAEKHLTGAQSIFDVPYKNSGITSAANESRGASAVEDPILADPAFQKAMTSAFKQLENDPHARSDFSEMVQNSPSARRALMNAQKQMDAADELRNADGADAQKAQAPDNGDDHAEGPTLH